MLQWNAADFETEAASRKMCATAFRSFDEWDKHPQGIASANTPPVTITKIGEAPRRSIGGKCGHALEGIRVLDLSRVLAGPVCGRTLAGSLFLLPSAAAEISETNVCSQPTEPMSC